MSSAPDQASGPQVWVSVIDPETEDGRQALTNWDTQTPVDWAVPAGATTDDLVLAWVTGGTGFRYLLEIVGSPRKAADDEFGPQQGSLRVVELIDPSLPMTRLKADPALRSWWLVRYNMQGVVRAQQHSLTLDPPWGVFLQLLETIAPKVATALRAAPAIGATAGTGGSTPERGATVVDTVSFEDEGSTTPQQMIVSRGLASVLARASAINEKRSSYDLSFSSLLLAILHGDDPLGHWLEDYFTTQGVKVEHALGKVRKDATSAQAAADSGMERRDAILASPLRRTVSARQALEEASEIAEAQRVEPIDAPHLVAAMIALTNYHEEDFGALTLDRQRWGAAFVQHMARHATDAADVEFWRRFYTRRFPGHELPPLDVAERPRHRPDYDADAYTSNDLLAIEDEVSALAYVIAAKQTRPPLAVGLFGEWGSGKTFFMKHLRQRIDRLCEGARAQPASKRDCHGHIAQIEFNAWHYQEGDLWASLVDHILRNLRFGEDEEEAKVAERRDQIVRELDVTEARQTAAAARAVDADRRVDEAQRLVERLRGEEETRRKELASQLTPGRMLTAARAGITLDATLHDSGEELAEAAGVPVAQANAIGLQAALAEAQRELAGVWAFLVPLFRADDRVRRIVMLTVAIAVPAVLVIGINALLAQHELVGRLTSVVVGLGTFAAAAARWIRAQTEWVRGLRARIEPVARDIDKAVDAGIEAGLSEQRQAVADKLAELDSLRAQQAQAQTERDDAAAQAVTLKSTLAVLGDDGLMRAFLDDRIGGGVYQQKLGIAALVRRDFERLSRKIEQVTGREGEDKLRPGELVINRIVLYIDDLDRCEMDKVVPVLRAVHLLLAFQAFVVVVGVDSRWVARCLERHHPDIFVNGERDAQAGVTPLDYLEKIFQIPIWLEPVPPDRRVFMVRELMRKPLPRAPAAPGPARLEPDVKGKTPDPQPAGEEGSDGGSAIAGTVPAAPKPQTPPVVSQERYGTALDLNPKGLSITDGEYDFLGHIGGLLSSSPRTIKRFVNTYRLINVTLAQAGFRDSELSPRDSEIRMLLLAVLVGMPDLSRWLQEALSSPNGVNLALTPLVEVMRQRADAIRGVSASSPRENAIAQWEMVHDWIERRGEPWTTMPAARLAEWLDPVGRYTFNLRRSSAGQSMSPAGAAE